MDHRRDRFSVSVITRFTREMLEASTNYLISMWLKEEINQ